MKKNIDRTKEIFLEIASQKEWDEHNSLNKILRNYKKNNGSIYRIDELVKMFEQVKKDFSLLSPKSRVKLYCDLLQYGLPKLQAVQIETEFDRLPEDQLDKIIEELKKVE